MKHKRLLFSGGSSWHDTEKLGLNISVIMLYIVGLLSFQKITGVMDWGKPTQPIKLHPQHKVYDAYETKHLYGHPNPDFQQDRNSPIFRHLLSAQADSESLDIDSNTEPPGITSSTNNSITNETVTSNKKKDSSDEALFPKDLFDKDQLRQGWVTLYIIGLVYMFVALAIVCDEFFVPALDVIIDVTGCSEDVAGATFMAAGGSAPELFTSVIGVFVAFSDVGIGTIVGSAVFNILFVIGMCALFSKTVLHLTWWPLFRDCAFYSISLLTLIAFFLDEKILWYEALALLCIYASYVLFMKINVQAERFVKRLLYKNKVTRVRSTDHLVPSHHSAAAALAGVTGAAMSGVVASDGPRSHTSIPVLHAGSHFRHGLLQLMIHTIDPLHDGKVDEKATQLHAIASLKVLLDATKPQDGANGTATGAGEGNNIGGGGDQAHDSGRASQGTEVAHVDAFTNADQLSQTGLQNGIPSFKDGGFSAADAGAQANEEVRAAQAADGQGQALEIDEVQPEPLDMAFPDGFQKQVTYLMLFPIIFPLWLTLPDTRSQKGQSIDSEMEEDENQPLDLSWPDSWRERVTYLLFLPIIIPLYITLPDTRKQSARKFFPITFFGSILWIAAFSYLMVWWATVTGQTFGIPPEVMGLTFLAAGTSIPDLITSVIVARKGFGDMAVSSSVGSNIFDVTVGLPLPWLLFTLIKGESVSVSAEGMVCSVAILFMMLCLVFLSILVFNWKMTKTMGIAMFLLYFVFVAVSLGFQYDYIICPIGPGSGVSGLT